MPLDGMLRELARRGERTVSQLAEPVPSKGTEVLLAVIHGRLPDRATLRKVGAGWHMHLDVLLRDGPAFWDGWSRLQMGYDQRHPTD